MSERLRTPRQIRTPDDPHSPISVAYTAASCRDLITPADLHRYVAESGLRLSETPLETPDGPIYPSLARRFGVSSMRLMSADDIAESLVAGLCGDLRDHDPHLFDSVTLGPFWCHADQSRRLR